MNKVKVILHVEDVRWARERPFCVAVDCVGMALAEAAVRKALDEALSKDGYELRRCQVSSGEEKSPNSPASPSDRPVDYEVAEPVRVRIEATLLDVRVARDGAARSAACVAAKALQDRPMTSPHSEGWRIIGWDAKAVECSCQDQE